MGETSKTSGEIGEALASSLLKKIGWKNFIKNISVPCASRSHINENNNQRQTHGEDQIYVYSSPFHDDLTEVVHISNKNHIGNYPSGQTLKTNFKAHIKQLVETIECAEVSEELRKVLDEVQAKATIHHSGLLTWFHNEGNLEHNIKAELANARMEAYGDIPICLIDNERAAFLMKVVNNAQSIDSGFVFYYPKIGTSITVDEKRAGRALPLELISADIIPVLIRKDGARELLIYANIPYDPESYKRLIGYSLSFATGLIEKIRIGLPNYNPAQHRQEISTIRLGFDQRNEEIETFSFNSSIMDLLEDK
ncbi:MAG: hypothetical protein ACM3Q1_02640 [Bacteroidales bacterium]